jgi:hypothetical protein
VSEAESSRKARVLGNEDLERGRGYGNEDEKGLEEGTKGQEDKRSLRGAWNATIFFLDFFLRLSEDNQRCGLPFVREQKLNYYYISYSAMPLGSPVHLSG